MRTFRPSRRAFLGLSSGLFLSGGFAGCASLFEKEKGTVTQLNDDTHWARRQEWTGTELVKGVARMGDRYLMVRRRDAMQWDFPGGVVRSELHGVKSKKNTDLVSAVTAYVHSQGMIQVVGESANLIAYGYAIDVVYNQSYLIHWLSVVIPSTLLPVPHPNFQDVVETQWVALDDPLLKSCLQKRMREYEECKEGGTVLLEPCVG